MKIIVLDVEQSMKLLTMPFFEYPPVLQTWSLAQSHLHPIGVPQRKPVHKYELFIITKE